MISIPFEILREISNSLGIHILGYTDNQDLNFEKSKLENWQNNGYSGEMSYMLKSSEKLSSLKSIGKNVRTAVFFSLFYEVEAENSEYTNNDCLKGYGKVARYAIGKDYHKVLPKLLKLFIAKVKDYLNIEFNFRIFTDAIPIMERPFASRSGLGFIGKNTLLINPGNGSFSLLAGIVWSLNIIPANNEKLINISKKSSKDKNFYLKSGCGTCTKCINNCPTGAIIDAYTVDAKLCISYLTIEKRGYLNHKEREAIGGWIFGCDICQEVCPFNHKALKKGQSSNVEEFRSSWGSGKGIKLLEVFDLKTDESFINKFQFSPIKRIKRVGLIRNACIVAANNLFENSTDSLIELFNFESCDIIRSHALWSIFKIFEKSSNIKKQKLDFLLNKALKDTSIQVQEESKYILQTIS